MVKKELTKTTGTIMNSKEFKGLVDNALSDMDVMETALVNGGLEKSEARLKVQQIYFKNLKTFSDPTNAAIAIMAELKTRIDLDRVLNPEESLVSDKYVELLDQMRKTVDLVRKTQSMNITHKIQSADDKTMNFSFIDVEE